jgi:alpha-beta hydrolase superfamily lysophospholipase
MIKGKIPSFLRAKWIKRVFISCLLLFILLNWLAYNHAYRFTHFVEEKLPVPAKAEQLSTLAKINTLFWGINIPKPINKQNPQLKFENIKLQSADYQIDTWLIESTQAKATLILMHGYGSTKSSLIENAEWLVGQGYNVLLLDFRGHGKSSGNATSIGYEESQDAKAAYDYIQKRFPQQKIILFGSSMGAATVLKTMADYNLPVAGIIIECPFATMLDAVRGRVRIMGVPEFPVSELLVFWGGVQGGYWAFGHKPSEYAKKVKVPTLLLYGEEDERVTMAETQNIFQNLAGEKQLKIFPKVRHENIMTKSPDKWKKEIRDFFGKTLKIN